MFPSLKALRAFEAAARHSSFTDAANELFVSPAAVARHVKGLEEWAGASLFNRRAQGVELNALGLSMLPEFVAAFDYLGDAVQSLRAKAEPNVIRIAVLPCIAQLWLAPKMSAIRAEVEDIELSVTTLENPPNLKREPFDMSIFFVSNPLSDAHIELCRNVTFPVCSPALAAKLREPADLADATFLHDACWLHEWDTWMAKACPNASIDTEGSVFTHYGFAVAEAKNGSGVLIGHEPLVRDDLARGDLVAPFETVVKCDVSLAIEVARPKYEELPLGKVVDAVRNIRSLGGRTK
jgi:DNA-binding transcriptional LysR family regulator